MTHSWTAISYIWLTDQYTLKYSLKPIATVGTSVKGAMWLVKVCVVNVLIYIYLFVCVSVSPSGFCLWYYAQRLFRIISLGKGSMTGIQWLQSGRPPDTGMKPWCSLFSFQCYKNEWYVSGFSPRLLLLIGEDNPLLNLGRDLLSQEYFWCWYTSGFLSKQPWVPEDGHGLFQVISKTVGVGVGGTKVVDFVRWQKVIHKRNNK